jgi:hypothetical protein
MPRIGIFQTPDYSTFQAIAQPLLALGNQVIDETHISDITQLPIGAIDMAVFLSGTSPIANPALLGQLWTNRQLPVFTQSASSQGVIPIASANCYSTLWGYETGDVAPAATDPLTVGWTTGFQVWQGGFNPGVLTARCDILTLFPGTEVLGVVTNQVPNAGTPDLNGMPVYLRLTQSSTQFWIHWHNGKLGDASWSQDLATYITQHVAPTSNIPTCDPTSNCPAPNVCIGGMCFAPCVAGTCAPPNVCQNGVCVGPCSPTTCPPPNQCINGICSPPCQNGQCVPPSTCQNGYCVEPCSPQNCPTPDQCVNGYCASPCVNGQCPAGFVCTNGYCVPITGGPGASGQWWPYLIAIGVPAVWAGAARLHELGKI